MNPLPLFLIIVTLPLLLGGCGEKPEGVNAKKLEERESITYLKGSDTPYTGKAFTFYENGQKWQEVNYKNGKPDGLWVSWYENGQKGLEGNFKDGKQHGLWLFWHENGQKRQETNYKDGERISEKWWNSKGEPVDSQKEALKE